MCESDEANDIFQIVHLLPRSADAFHVNLNETFPFLLNPVGFEKQNNQEAQMHFRFLTDEDFLAI